MTTYKDAGVDIDAGNKAVHSIRELMALTHRNVPGRVIGRHGSFSGLTKLPKGCRILGSTTDGVGTKLLLAVALDEHDTVGVDLVAMCVNDLLVEGLLPWSFLDYIAMDKQIPERTEAIIRGITAGCLQAGIALVGGEMAELPGMYHPESPYDLVGMADGIAEDECDLLHASDIKPGMRVYGLYSSGVHSNGFSLVRRVFGMSPSDPAGTREVLETVYPELGSSLGETLLTPTRIYAQEVRELREGYHIVGIAHITGGGLFDNPPRILPEGCAMRLYSGSWDIPPIFRFIEEYGNVSPFEMRRTFNIGLGMLVVSPDDIPHLPRVGEIMTADRPDTRFV